jgi:hypothetical protein
MKRFVGLIMVAGCAHDVVARFPLAAPGDTGAIDVVLNDPSGKLTIAVDDLLVVDREHSRHAHIMGVPAGTAHVRVATGGRCDAGAVTERDVAVTPGMTTTLALPGPNPDHGCMVYLGLLVVSYAIDMVVIAMLGSQHRELASHIK